MIAWVQEFWTFGFTREGKWFSFAVLLATAIGIGSIDMPLYILVAVLGWVIIGAVAVGVYLRPRMAMRKDLPDRVIAGAVVNAAYHVTNIAHRPAYDVGVLVEKSDPSLAFASAPPPLASIDANGSHTFRVSFKTLRRGLYAWPEPKCFSQFPFGLFRFTRKAKKKSHAPQSNLLVLPSFHPIEHLELPVGRRYQPGGIALSSHIGESPEYIGNRDYRPGDPTRHIDFRSWARLSRPVIREYEEEYYCRVALVLDTFVPRHSALADAGVSAVQRITNASKEFAELLARYKIVPAFSDRPPTGFPGLEAAISLAAAIADALARSEYILDIFAAGPKLHIFRSGRSMAHFENVLEILACIDECRQNPFEQVTPALQDELGNISTVICVFLDWDTSRELLARAAQEAGASLKIFVVRDGETSVPLPDADAFDITHLTPQEVTSGGISAL
jgi:uncharacterized protein (DUF58 family)